MGNYLNFSVLHLLIRKMGHVKPKVGRRGAPVAVVVVLVSSIGGDMEAQGGMCQVHSLQAGKGQALDSSLGSCL